MYKTIDELGKEVFDQKNAKFLTGHKEFDEFCNGFNPGELISITGKAGSAAEVLFDNLALRISETGDVLLFKHKISEQTFKKQIAKNLGTTNSDYFLDRSLSLNYAFDVFFIEEIEKSVAEFTRKFPEGIIFISTLQSLFLSKEISHLSREEEIKRIIFNLKRIASLHKVPVIIYSNINTPEENSDIPACLSDLDCFGEAQRAFDKIIFTYWPAYYNKPPSIFPDDIKVTIAGGAKSKYGAFDLELIYPKYKIHFDQC